jgi:GTPase involved in cell partitioning and DNA repair
VIVGLPNSGKTSLLNALTGARATVAPYPRSTKEPAFGPIEDDAGHLMTVADLPGVDETGVPRPDGKITQIERARVIVHCVDGREPDEIPSRVAAVREGIAEYRNPEQTEIVVATFTEPDACPAGADLAVDSVTGAGVDTLRDEILRRLAG